MLLYCRIANPQHRMKILRPQLPQCKAHSRNTSCKSRILQQAGIGIQTCHATSLPNREPILPTLQVSTTDPIQANPQHSAGILKTSNYCNRKHTGKNKNSKSRILHQGGERNPMQMCHSPPHQHRLEPVSGKHTSLILLAPQSGSSTRRQSNRDQAH
jgi:hypothetical protein